MPLSIKNEATERLARQVAGETGECQNMALIAVFEMLDRGFPHIATASKSRDQQHRFSTPGNLNRERLRRLGGLGDRRLGEHQEREKKEQEPVHNPGGFRILGHGKLL